MLTDSESDSELYIDWEHPNRNPLVPKLMYADPEHEADSNSNSSGPDEDSDAETLAPTDAELGSDQDSDLPTAKLEKILKPK